MKKTTLISMIIFFGALWGILEATLGAVLHLVPIPFLAGSIMFPIAAVILLKAYPLVLSKTAMLAIGLIAAMIKAINFLTPMNQWGIINPIIAIILESLIVVGLVGYLTKAQIQHRLLAVITASLAWRLAFLGWYGLQFITTGFLADQLTSMSVFLSFTVLQGLLSGLLAFGLYETLNLMPKPRIKRLAYQPLIASIALLIAFALSYLL